jgi:hypothetical protein
MCMRFRLSFILDVRFLLDPHALFCMLDFLFAMACAEAEPDAVRNLPSARAFQKYPEKRSESAPLIEKGNTQEERETTQAEENLARCCVGVEARASGGDQERGLVSASERGLVSAMACFSASGRDTAPTIAQEPSAAASSTQYLEKRLMQQHLRALRACIEQARTSMQHETRASIDTHGEAEHVEEEEAHSQHSGAPAAPATEAVGHRSVAGTSVCGFTLLVHAA